jgi:hypothetical protein
MSASPALQQAAPCCCDTGVPALAFGRLGLGT